MKVSSATFIVEHKQQTFRVQFNEDTITVWQLGAGVYLSVHLARTIDYKPCATHAIELVKLALGKSGGSEFAKGRRKRINAALGVANG